jgi:hypothetical protein
MNAIERVDEWGADRQARASVEAAGGAEAILADDASLFGEAQRLANVGIWTWNPETGDSVWSAGMYRIFGRGPECGPATYEDLRRILSRDDWERVANAVGRAVATGDPYEVDCELALPDGVAKWIVMRGKAVRDAGDRIIGLHGTIQDITERKRTETELRRLNETLEARVEARTRELSELNRVLLCSEARFRSLAAFSPIGIFLNDASGNCIYTNERCQDIFGISEEQFLGDGWSAGVHPDDRARVCRGWEHARDAVVEFVDEYRVLRPDGELRHVRIQVRPVVVEGQPPSGFVGCVEDVTARRRADDALIAAKAAAERANDAKSRFLAAASHDLRQPLAALALYVGMLEHRFGADVEPLFGSMKDCVLSLSELLTDLLDLSKLEAGVITPNVSDFAVDDVIGRMLAAHAPEAHAKRLSLRFRSCGLCSRTDPVLYARIIGNLVSNAVRYTRRGGVLIACRRRRDGDWIEVWDTGIGIPDDMMGEVFDEFRQLSNGEHSRGSGLGLTIVARMAALLGVRVRVCSRVGKGSMFAVELPRGGPVDSAAKEGLPRLSLRIALVDDNPLLIRALEEALEAIGHQVVAASSGANLLGRIDAFTPDVVISDYRLAGKETGFDVIESVRAAVDRDLAAIIITGDTDPGLIRRITDRHIVALHKPVELEALQRCIVAVTRSAPAPAAEPSAR